MSTALLWILGFVMVIVMLLCLDIQSDLSGIPATCRALKRKRGKADIGMAPDRVPSTREGF